MSEEVVIIGGGPAGIEAAREAAKLGLDVAVVSAGEIGGRAGWHSLLPSKVWLAAAETAQECEEVADMDAAQWGPAEILARLAQVKADWNSQARQELDDLGVRIVHGMASFVSPDEVQVKDGEGSVVGSFAGAPVVAATGSVPFFPPGLRPDGKRVIAPRLLSKLAELPSSIVVIGAGATGCEAAYLFNALGVEVTWIVDQFGILPLFHGEAGAALGEALGRQGVKIAAGQMVETLEREDDKVTAVLVDGERVEAEMAFVAVGRRPDWSALNMTAAGVEPGDDGRIHVDEFGRTANPRVFLVGDADGGIMTANKALAQGRIAARCIAGVDVDPFSARTLIQPVYTYPQVAQVGDMNGGDDVAVTRVQFSQTLKAFLLPAGDGFLDLVYDVKNGRVLGALAVGPHAADVLTPVALAIRLKGKVEDLTAVYAGYPSLGELAFIAARDAA